MEKVLGEQKRKNFELSELTDPNAQLIKSMSSMIQKLQEDMEVKRRSDSEIVKLVLYGQQQEAQRSEKLERTLDAKIGNLEQRVVENQNAVTFKLDEHDEQLQLLNQAYVSTHTQF